LASDPPTHHGGHLLFFVAGLLDLGRYTAQRQAPSAVSKIHKTAERLFGSWGNLLHLGVAHGANREGRVGGVVCSETDVRPGANQGRELAPRPSSYRPVSGRNSGRPRGLACDQPGWQRVFVGFFFAVRASRVMHRAAMRTT
jgi:hypothetical protein